MKVWWVFDSARFALEKSVIEQLPKQGWFKFERWLIDLGLIAVDGVIVAQCHDYPIRLVYPDQFPYVPAWVQPRDAKARWSSHQYGKGGILCLELRPDNWNLSATGADVLRSAFHLLEQENPLGEGEKTSVDSAHRTGEIQNYDVEGWPVIVSVGCIDRVKNQSAVELKALRWELKDQIWPIMISDAEDRKGLLRPPDGNVGCWGSELPVVVTRGDIPAEGKLTHKALSTAIGMEVNSIGNPGVVLVLGATRNVAYHVWGDDAFPRRLLMIDSQHGMRSGRKDGVVDKCVAIIGAGSLGSKIAEMLVRSGVGKLVLVDGDVLLPGNLERHALDWRDVGFLKANALKRKLLLIAPGAAIRVITNNLNWQRSAKTHAREIEHIADCDLILDATGDSATTLFLGAVAAENKRPFVTAVVFEGGLGLMIARSIPGRDAEYVNGLAAFNAYCEQSDTPPPISGRKDYESFNSEGTLVVADDAAVSMAAAHASRTTLDILDEAEIDKAAWLLVGCRKGWVFQRHGHTISLDVGEPRNLDATQNDVALAFAKGLLKEYLNAPSPA